MADNYKEKIKKLLALAESDNENEAKAALLKAKELMAQHKIEEADFEDAQNKKVVRVKTKFTCSKRRDSWMGSLSAVIARNFCCQATTSRKWNHQTRTVTFVGLEGDIDTCVAVFEYAVSCTMDGIKKIKRDYADFSQEYRKRLCDGYGFGFAEGVSEAFKKQEEQDETGWGLVMVVPKEVHDAVKELKPESIGEAAASRASKALFYDGYEDGKKFDPSTKLTAADEKEKIMIQ